MRTSSAAVVTGACLLLASHAQAAQAAGGASGEIVRIEAGALTPAGKVDERFQSFQISFSHVTGGRTWKSYGASPKAAPPTPEQVAKNPSLLYERRDAVDLANPRLRRLTAALGPLYIRYGGTTANSVYFQGDEGPPPAEAPPGFTVVLTRAAWKSAVDFARAADARILTSFTISSGVRDASGAWTPREAAPWLAYTRAIGGDIYAAELFNEPNFSSFGQGPKLYSADDFARDFKVFQAFARATAPNIKLVGPGDSVTTVQAPGPTPQQLMTGAPRPHFDIVSYHFYPAIAPRCAPADSPMGISADRALSEEFLARADKVFQARKALRDRYAPGAPIWLTETGAAACGGPPWQPTFLDAFRFADQEGRLARQGLDVMFSHALIGKNYGLLDEGTYDPRPTYWTALLWRRLMGVQVLQAGDSRPGLHLYAQCLRGAPGGVALLTINLDKAPAAIELSGRAQLYALTAPELQSRTVLLNGRPLMLGAGDRLPVLTPVQLKAMRVVLAPTSINFIAVPRARNPSCAE